MRIKHDDLYARAWECEYEKPIFDSDYNDAATPHSSGITIRTDKGTDETSTVPNTIPENSPELFHQADDVCDETDTDQFVEPTADMSVEQTNATPINPSSTK